MKLGQLERHDLVGQQWELSEHLLGGVNRVSFEHEHGTRTSRRVHLTHNPAAIQVPEGAQLRLRVPCDLSLPIDAAAWAHDGQKLHDRR